MTPKYRKGQAVAFKDSKGKKRVGKIIAVKADADTPFYRIRVEDFERPFNVEYDEVLKAAGKPKPPAEEDEPAPKKKPGKKPKKDEFEDDEFEQTFGGGDDEEEEDPKPKKKPGKKPGKPKKDEDVEDDDPF